MSGPPPPYSPPRDGQASRDYEVDGEDHELRGLLAGADSADAEQPKRANARKPLEWLDDHVTKRRKHLGILAVVFIVLLLGAAFAPSYFRGCGSKAAGAHPNSKFVGSELRSNGTHDYKRTVLIVSIDGLRYGSDAHFRVSFIDSCATGPIILTEGSRLICWTLARRACGRST